jgi:outer membrane protein assembly factor BamD (BamD/ComL family)
MNWHSVLSLLFIISLWIVGCESKKPVDKQTSRDILSSRTLGLAYLEENKLEEAEAEFLKLIDLAPEEALGHANLGLVYLRMGKYEEAEENLENAIDLKPDDPDISLILTKVYELNNQPEESILLLNKIIKSNPKHPKTLYALAEYYEKSKDPESLNKRKEYLSVLVDEVPENMVARLLYIEALVQNEESDEAIAQMEELVRIFPEFPDEAGAYYDQTLEALRAQNAVAAYTPIKIFHNFFKVSSPYQAGIQDLKGPGGELIGFPLITMGESTGAFWFEGEDVLDAIKFTDVTSTVGLDQINSSLGNNDYETSLAISDYDGDGDLDIYFGRHGNNYSNPEHFLFKNEMGSYSETSGETGIDHTDADRFAIFGDYDNDGFLDLYLITNSNNRLYRNVGEGEFEDTAGDAGIDNQKEGNVALFFDFDHEGDLDIFLANPESNALLRNNGDGSFLNVASTSGLSQQEKNTVDACFGDFDDDGDIDLFLANKNGPYSLMDNKRQGRFENITGDAGLDIDKTAVSVDAGDYNNDGYLDLLVMNGDSKSCDLYKNKGDGTFEKDTRSDETFEKIYGIQVKDMIFFDFDNDGFEDILIAGNPETQEKRGLFLFHNDSLNIFSDVSHLLPEDVLSATRIITGDFNEDGDQDIYLTGYDGKVRLLRNDGGNVNHYLKLQLVGVRTGSSKNNHFGIGSKVEVRAGELYQMKVVTQPDMHFGLGDRSGADVVRILWTNGTPQNIFTPRSDQDLIEEQELKGSCPFLYTWNGHEYVFVKDMMWRSALGMPLGIMAEDTKYAFGDASKEYLKIPGELLQPKDDVYSIQITSELWETMFYDELYLVAVDHPEDMEIYVDEKFTPPPFPGLDLFTIKEQNVPVKAYDDNGHDLLPYIDEKDDEYISNFKLGAFQGITEMKDVILDLGDNIDKGNVYLFMDGWIFPTDASINIAISQSEKTKVIAPYIQVIDSNGKWVTAMENVGFPMGKNKTIIVDLSDKFPTDDHRVRIRTNMQIYWDYIFHSPNTNDTSIISTQMNPSFADLHYRGFSEMYRKGNRYGPHWFNYNEVSEKPKWRDLEGKYTRYGDVIPLLEKSDNMYVIANAGDEMTIEFDVNSLPELKEGWKRDFLIYSVGWVKDGDMNTAQGQTVEPLPFHDMSEYPYGEKEYFPSDYEYQRYMESYNVREITSEQFERAIYDLY